jgi:hypothetical protein
LFCFSGEDSAVASELVRILADSQQEVPEFLQAASTGGGGGGGGKAFGGTDMRKGGAPAAAAEEEGW